MNVRNTAATAAKVVFANEPDRVKRSGFFFRHSKCGIKPLAFVRTAAKFVTAPSFDPMHTIDVSRWKHGHNFVADTSSAEKRTRKVIALTAVMMVVEIVAGSIFHSMALLADGWH